MTLDFFNTLAQHLDAGQPVVVATIVRGEPGMIGKHLLISRQSGAAGDIAAPDLAAFLQQQAPAFFARERSEILPFGEMEIFFESIFPAPKLIIIGAVHIAIPLATIAKTLDYQVILIDPRGAFATAERFPHVDRLVRQWPEEALQEIGLDAGSCMVILTHDAKLDDPALKFALQHQPAYIGVLGSKRTHEKRMARMKAAGFTEEQLKRVHAPVGLELGASTPAEIALSIAAEMVAVRRRQ